MQSLMGLGPCRWASGMRMTEGIKLPLPMKKGFGATDRVDAWWKGPTAMVAYLGFMIVYATWRGMMESDFWYFEEFGRSAGNQTMAIESQGSHVLSPLFSPLIIPGKGAMGSLVPMWLAWMSPAMFILVFPAGFRATCYYYRKAYYRAFMQQPTGCAVSKPWDEYSGETGLLVVQNLHRYFMYVMLIYLPNTVMGLLALCELSRCFGGSSLRSQFRFNLSTSQCAHVGWLHVRMPRLPTCNRRRIKRLDRRYYGQNQV